MAAEVRRIELRELASDVAGVFERVARDQETVVVEKDGVELAVVKPVVKARPRPRRRHVSAADREALLASFGGWRGLVDTEQLKRDIYESRRLSSRPPVDL
jgi:hypothetical protein